MIRNLGGTEIFFMQEAEYFRSIVVSSGIWKDVGWNTIIYLAALAGINPQLYEAAEVDGAGKLRQVWSITIPSLLPTIVVLFLLQIGNYLDLGFEQIYMLLNPLVRETGEVLDTYIYRVGLLGGQYSYTTAIGLFKSVVGLILVVGANQLSKKNHGEFYLLEGRCIHIKESLSRRIFIKFNYVFLIFLSLFMLLPYLHVLAGSFSGGEAILQGAVTIFPVDFTLVTLKLC